MKSLFGRRAPVLVLCALVAWVSSVAAADSDGDGLPDALERRLGTDPQRAEAAREVWSAPAAAPAPAGATPGRDLRRVMLAHVAADRWLWILEFADDYETANSNLLLYIDANNNPQRGQRHPELQGTDFVLWFSDGGRWCHAYTATGEGSRPAPTRFGVDGRRVYLCTDMTLAQVDGASQARAWARSEQLEPRQEIASTGWFAVTAPAQDRSRKPEVNPFGDTAQGNDEDGDGLSDGQEAQLGTDPTRPEAFEVVFDSAAAPAVPARTRARAEHPERTVRRLSVASVGGERWVWCVEFEADYPTQNSNVILYVDADNDRTTGRTNLPGIDTMLGCADGRPGMTAFAPDGQLRNGPALRGLVVGPRLYLSSDLALNHADGRAQYRISLLSETRTPPAAIDRVGDIMVNSAGAVDRPLPRGLESLDASQGMAMTRGLDLIRRVKADPANAVVKIGNCDFEGFMDDLGSEYKVPSAIRTTPGGRILVKVPRTGAFHPAVLLYDQPGTEVIELRRQGQRLGVAVAAENDNRTKLFVSEARLDLQAGEVIELRTPYSGGSYRVEDILFLAGIPEIRPRHLAVQHLETSPLWVGDSPRTDAVRLTWITTWPAACTVTFDNRTITEDTPVANHRVVLDGLESGRAYDITVSAPRPDGNGALTERLRFRARAPRVPEGSRLTRVPLHVINPSGEAVRGWPVTAGVAFPAGVLAASSRVSLLDPDGNPVPLQAATQARWPDGSVKWSLLNFRATLPAASSLPFALEFGSAAPAVAASGAPDGVRVEPTPEGVRVVNGLLQVDLRRDAVALPGRVACDRNGDGVFSADEVVLAGDAAGAVALVDAEGRTFSSLGPADAIVVEEAGPERAVVLLKGRHQGDDGQRLFAWEARLTLAAGQRAVRLAYTFGNDTTSTDFTALRSLALRLPMAGGAERYDLGAESALAGETAQTPRLVQDLDNHYQIRAGDQTIDGRRAPGWLRLQGPRGTMTVAVRDFWQLYPKGLAVSPDGARIDLLPALDADLYDKLAEDPVKLVQLYYNLQKGLYRFRQGQTRTHDLLIAFDDEPSAVGLEAFQRGVMATPDSSWTCATGVFGEVAPMGTAWSSRLDPRFSQGAIDYLKARDSRQDYGLMNFGDWWGERRHNWGNLEYDDTHVFLRHFARTGDTTAWTAGDRGAKHYADVDTIHYHADPWRVGAAYTHCIGHVGGFLTSMPVDGGSLTGGHSPCHTRVEGLVEHYLLTGDRRSWDAAVGIADRYGSWWLNNYDFTICRVPGWHLILTLAVYQVTNDPFYLNVARIITDRILERETPGGGWHRNLVPGHCFCLPRHRGNAGFMVGVMLSGLKGYHQATGDERAAGAIVRGARYVVREMYDPIKQQFRYTSCPNTGQSDSTGQLLCEGIAYAARLSADPELVAITRELVTRMTVQSYRSASAGRFLPQAAWDVERLGPDAYALATHDNAAGPTVEVVADNPTGRDLLITLLDADQDAVVEAVAPDGSTLALEAVRGTLGERCLTGTAKGMKGPYRLRCRGVSRLVTNLDGEALAVGAPTALHLPGRLTLEVAAAARDGAALRLQGRQRGRYRAEFRDDTGRVLTEASWRGGARSDWQRLAWPTAATPTAVLRLHVEGPEGAVLLQAEGVPPYLSAPSGKVFRAGQPLAAFSSGNPLRPGAGMAIALDASSSTDADNDIVDYAWSIAGQAVANGRTATLDLAALPAGGDGPNQEVDITLTVRDAFGATDTTSQRLAVAPAWFLNLDPASAVLVEAESFSAEGGGKVRIVSDRIGHSGSMLTGWHESPEHWLEWTVAVPRDGDYRVILKYATDSLATHRSLTLDGQSPGKAFERFHLPPTGGFCTARNDWRYHTLGGPESPAALRLSAGTHRLRLANLGDGCALDFIILAPLANPAPTP